MLSVVSGADASVNPVPRIERYPANSSDSTSHRQILRQRQVSQGNHRDSTRKFTTERSQCPRYTWTIAEVTALIATDACSG